MQSSAYSQFIKRFSINLNCKFILIQQKALHYKDWHDASLNPIMSLAIKKLTPTDGLMLYWVWLECS